MNHHSECFFDGNNRKHLLNDFIVFSRQGKNKESISFNYIKIKHVSFIKFKGSFSYSFTLRL